MRSSSYQNLLPSTYSSGCQYRNMRLLITGVSKTGKPDWVSPWHEGQLTSQEAFWRVSDQAVRI